MKHHEGIIVPMLTPFDDEGRIDKEKLEWSVERLISKGVHGLFPCSSVGETSNMTVSERIDMMELVIEVAGGRVPVIPGTGSSDLETAIELTRIAQDLGADGAVVVTPYYLKPDQTGLYTYYERVASSVDIPVYLYQLPMATGVEILADTVSSLASELDNIAGLKDSSGNMSKLMEILRKTDKDFLIFQGWDSLLFPSLCVGCAGGMVSTPNIIPEPVVELYESYREGEIKKAYRLQVETVGPFFDACMNHGVFPAGFKESAKLLGVDLGRPRPPIRDLNQDERGRLVSALKEIGLLH